MNPSMMNPDSTPLATIGQRAHAARVVAGAALAA